MGRTLTKAGTVTFRRTENGSVQILLITSKLGDRWILPMGTIEPGEAPDATAARETREEAGFDVAVIAPLGDMDSVDLKQRPQRCRLYLARCAGEVKWSEAHRRQRRWLEPEQAETELAEGFGAFIAPAMRGISDTPDRCDES